MAMLNVKGISIFPPIFIRVTKTEHPMIRIADGAVQTVYQQDQAEDSVVLYVAEMRILSTFHTQQEMVFGTDTASITTIVTVRIVY